MSITIVFTLFGGLAFFLFGMRLMGEGLERAAGPKLKHFLSLMTRNKFIAMITGICVTAIIQSSGATTVMVVGFVNAQLLTLAQSVGVIIGANIGTTVTSLLLSIKFDPGPVFALIGMLMIMAFDKKETLKQAGMVFMGLGVLFIGMDLMSSSTEPLREWPVFLNLMRSVENPLLGVLVGILIGCLSYRTWAEIVAGIPAILGLGIKMGAVMELIPRITSLFIEGLKPIAEATKDLVSRKFKNSAGINIGMSPALVIGHPTTLVVSLLLIPCTLLLAVVLPGNEFLPLASLAGMFYVFPAVLPVTKGNVVKTFLIGLVALTVGLYFVTDLAPWFTLAAQDVYARTGDAAVAIPEGFQGGALDFASSIFSWVIFHLVHDFKWVGSAILVAGTTVMAIFNRRRIIKASYEKNN